MCENGNLDFLDTIAGYAVAEISKPLISERLLVIYKDNNHKIKEMWKKNLDIYLTG